MPQPNHWNPLCSVNEILQYKLEKLSSIDNAALLQIMSKIPILKYRCLWCFSLNFLIFLMLNETSQFVNTTNKVTRLTVHIGLSWHKLNDSYFFGDSLKATSLQIDRQMNKQIPHTTIFLPVNRTIVQKENHLSGFIVSLLLGEFLNSPFQQ